MGRKIAGGSSNGGSSSNGDSGSYERGAGGGSNKESRRILPAASDLKWLDQFPYFPSYRYHPYRSCCGAVGSIIMMSTLLLRVTSAMVDYVDRPPIVTEAREQFPRDAPDQYPLPRIGVQFRQNGWKPFNDPRYIAITFDQGVIQKSGNVTYTSLGGKECSFIDKDGRLIADDARCASGRVAGSAPHAPPHSAHPAPPPSTGARRRRTRRRRRRRTCRATSTT